MILGLFLKGRRRKMQKTTLRSLECLHGKAFYFGATAFSIMTLSIQGVFLTININDTEYKSAQQQLA
jgi:hypothetical protein